MEPIVDPALHQFATELQLKYIELINEFGGYSSAARKLGINPDAVRNAMRRLKTKAAMRGYSPEHDMTKMVPAPYLIKGTSTNYDSEGNITSQWVKTKADESYRMQMILDAIEDATNPIERLPPIKAPKTSASHLCNMYTFTDYHMGMLAWHKEGGADWDRDIAERTLIGAFEQMITMSPEADTCIINQLGDFLHYDGLAQVTPTSHHMVEADGNYSQMVNSTIRALRRVIDIALMKHKNVHLIMAEGNHDLASSVWLRHLFTALYENEPRLTVNNSEIPYYVYQHGKVMLGFHHGHKKKKEGLPLLFAAKFHKIWGETTKRYIHTGHYHHEDVKEFPGVKVIQHPTLAAADSYAARGGWMSEQQTSCVTYHNEFGKVGEVVVNPEMLNI